jgi:hypothetical protein
MFELERTIQDWRNGLLQSQNVLESDVDELESHVRDEVESLMLAGLSAEEAFMVSTHRIGDNNAVAQEFAKVNTKEVWRNRVFWMLSGVFTFMVIGSLSSFFSDSSKWILLWLKINPAVTGYVSSSVHVVVFIGAVFIWVAFLGNLSSKVFRRYKTFRNILLQGILLVVLLKILNVAAQMLYANYLYAKGIGEMVLASRYVLFGWGVLWPIILMGLLLWLRPSKKEATG